jgi:DNA-binding response OmpR family regulator
VLLARAKRLLDSRNRPTASPTDTLTLGGVRVHFPSRSVTVDGEAISMTYTEFEIITYLMLNRGIVITREQLITKIWGYENTGDDRTVNTHIRNIRSKLGPKGKLITTVVRIGYKFEENI